MTFKTSSSERKAFKALSDASNTNKSPSVEVFALASDHGSINLSKQKIILLQKDGLSDHVLDLANNMEDKNHKTFHQFSKYFETHYKYTYALRTAQKLTLEYLRLPQSSIHKDE